MHHFDGGGGGGCKCIYMHFLHRIFCSLNLHPPPPCGDAEAFVCHFPPTFCGVLCSLSKSHWQLAVLHLRDAPPPPPDAPREQKRAELTKTAAGADSAVQTAEQRDVFMRREFEVGFRRAHVKDPEQTGMGGVWHDTRLCCCPQLPAPVGLSPLTAALPLNPFPVGGGAHRPLTALCPLSPCLAYPDLDAP